MRTWFICGVLLLAGLVRAEEIVLEGCYDGHLQDIWMEGDTIWWAHTGSLIRTDRTGKAIVTADVGGHHAGLEIRGGRLYTAVCAFNGEPRKATTPACHVMVGEYDAVTLNRIEMHVLDINDRAGSLCILEDGTFLVGCLRHPALKPSEVKFHHISRDFRLIKTHVVDVGMPVQLGIEVIRRYGADVYLFIYGGPVMKLDARDFSVKGRYKSFGGQMGFSRDGEFAWIGRSVLHPDDRKYHSKLERKPIVWEEARRKALSGPLSELMPVPVRIEPRAGTLAAADLGAPCVRTASVKGVPGGAADEAYCLDIAPTGVVITASGRRGAIWAKATLNQLAKLSGGRIPCCRIVDGPKFPWRGFMPDCGRNYIEVRHVKAMIDAMSANKMNLFHWHLTEYYGWRLESKRYPELQREDAFYLRHVGKYYTQDEFREIVDYAWERGVTVMPEFDVPGHALAFRRAFGFKTMRDDGVRERLCDLIDELCSLAPAEKMPYVHLGTDEARLPEEKVPPCWLEPMVRRVQAAGRTVVGWMPGELRGLEKIGPIAGMRWGRRADESSSIPCFDASGMYIDTLDPFELLGVAAFRKVCPWPESGSPRLGGVVCAWHDDAAKDGYDFLRNQAVMPAYTLFGDVFWRGREDAMRGSGRWMPKAGDPQQAPAKELERRVIAQRDKVWNDSPYPYHFLRQTDLSWRVTDATTGRVVARDLAQATVFLWQACNDGVEDGRSASAVGNVFTNRSGVAVLETWIRSPVTQQVGAWIGFTDYVRNHGRAFSAPTPECGKWSRTGATVEINGERVPPPAWRKPGQKAGGNVPQLLYVHELDEIPFEDEEYYMRPPTPIVLRQGWNHVKLTVPCRKAANYAPWVATFIPLLGTTEHPREVPDLVYSCDPRQN